jgi:hypothetical protein
LQRLLAHRRQLSRRRGLAPLEFTLALPLLLMAMALMVLIGTAGAWKVRTSANARQAIFRSMYPRTTDNDAEPSNWWPQSASMNYQGGGTSFLTDDPYANHPVVRGPSIADPETGNALRVLIDTLDMPDGMRSGRATINHEPPMWSRLGYRNAFSRNNVLFAGQTWQYGNLGIPDNDSRRILYTYDYEMSKYAPDAAGQARAAANAILTGPYRQELMVLDRDAELRAWYGNDIDFHPEPRSACTHDIAYLRSVILPDLLQRISDVPRNMAQRFLSMYQQQLQQLDAMQPPVPSGDPRRVDLQQKIQQLQDFLTTLSSA